MKVVVKLTSLCMLAIFIGLSGFLVPPVCSQANGDISPQDLPVLTATITSPADGARFQEGDCFEVTATITATCPVRQTDSSALIKPVLANDCTPAATNVSGTIEVTGNANVLGTATQQADNLYCDGQGTQCPNMTTVSWQVCCTGTGNVTITVTPAGDAALIAGNMDKLLSPVYAISTYPIPAENLISDTITITQEGEDFSQKLIKETSSGPSWANPSHVTTVNTWANTQTARAGQQVIVYANIANRGDIEGPYTATLSINGAVEEVKTGMIQGNTGIPLKFVVSRDEPGNYEVDVNGQKAYFTVIGETASEEVSSRDLPLTIALIIMASLIAVLVILIIRRRQQYLN